MGRTDAIKVGHGQLALVGSTFAEDNVAFAEAQFLPKSHHRCAPTPDLQRIAVQMFQTDIVLQVSVARFHSVVDVDGDLVETVRLSSRVSVLAQA